MIRLSLFLALFILPAMAHAEDLELTAPRGARIQVSVSVPDGRPGKAPALVLAPGQGYHMDLPLLKDLAAAAAARGVIVFRFNWSYFTSKPQGEPSEDLGREVEDMQTVVDFAKKDPRVDPAKIVVAGKSLGTLVSYSIFHKDPSFRGLVLLTPLCTDPDANGKPIGNESYPGFASDARPVHLTLGNADGLCQIPALYEFLKDTKGNVSVSVFAGGHSLTFGNPGDPANAGRDARNIAAAVAASAQWVDILLGN